MATFNHHNFAMNETVVSSHHSDEQSKLSSTLISNRLEQLGYQCLSDSCDRFTTLRLVPVETKRKEESIVPPSE